MCDSVKKKMSEFKSILCEVKEIGSMDPKELRDRIDGKLSRKQRNALSDQIDTVMRCFEANKV